MIYGQNERAHVVKIAALATNATTSGTFSVAGYDYCVIDVISDSVSATNVQLVQLKIEEADVATYATFTGSNVTSFGPGATAANITDRVCIDLTGRKKNLKVSVECTQATFLASIVARLSRGERFKVGTTDANIGCLTVL